MSPHSRRIALQRAARLFDLAAVSLTFLAAFAISAGAFTWPSLAHILGMRIALVNLILFALYLGFCSAVFSSCGFYRSHRLSHRTRRVREIFLAVTLITVMLFVLRGPFDLSFATNSFLLSFWLLIFATLVLSYTVAQRLLYYARSRGRNLRSIIIVGESREATALAEGIENDTTLGYRVLRIIDVKETGDDEQVANSIRT
jgi:FlaA1/EpsC-like NDP-sugar epimerase